jgi:hypothetical protein
MEALEAEHSVEDLQRVVSLVCGVEETSTEDVQNSIESTLECLLSTSFHLQKHLPFLFHQEKRNEK